MMYSESNLQLRGSCKFISNLQGVARSFDFTMCVDCVIEQFQSIPESFLPRFVIHRSSPVSVSFIVWTHNWCDGHHCWSFGVNKVLLNLVINLKFAALDASSDLHKSRSSFNTRWLHMLLHKHESYTEP